VAQSEHDRQGLLHYKVKISAAKMRMFTTSRITETSGEACHHGSFEEARERSWVVLRSEIVGISEAVDRDVTWPVNPSLQGSVMWDFRPQTNLLGSVVVQ
jgi:hypothetical protein